MLDDELLDILRISVDQVQNFSLVGPIFFCFEHIFLLSDNPCHTPSSEIQSLLMSCETFPIGNERVHYALATFF